jgi:hypothetical protein
VTSGNIYEIREIVRAGEYRKDPRSPEWIGHALADVLKLDAEDDKLRIKDILKTWFSNGVLKTESRPDEKSRMREWVVPGNWNESPAKGETEHDDEQNEQ